jgi:peptide/nickel transport system substrate-binding protein
VRRLAAIIAVASLVLAACSSSAKSTGTSANTTAAGSAGTPKLGGTLTIIKGTEQAAGWDPIKFLPVPTNSPTLIDFAVYDSLFYEDPTTTNLVPRLGMSLTSPDNGATWTLKLRPNVKFSDGTPFDASAVQFQWQRIADPANHALTASAAREVQTSTVVDPVTLHVALKNPDLVFNHRVAQDLNWIASPTAVKSQGANYGTHPVGAGPFLLQNWVLNSQYTLVKNPNYWEQGHPYLDQIIIKVIPDQAQGYNTFKAGGGNVIQLFDPQAIDQAKTDGYNVTPGIATGGGWAMGFNNSKPPFDNPLARKAMDLAINRDQFLQSRRSGDPYFAIPTIDKKGSPFYDPTITPNRYDPAQAQKYVDQYVAQVGHPLQFTYSAFVTPYLTQDAEQLQAQISQLKNVQMKLNIESSTQLIKDFNAGNFQAYESGVRWNVPAIDMVNWLLSTSNLNYNRYSNPDADAALRQLLTTSDVKTEIPLAHKVEKDVLNDSGVAWYAQFTSATAIDKAVKNYQIYFDQQSLLDNVWLSNG